MGRNGLNKNRYSLVLSGNAFVEKCSLRGNGYSSKKGSIDNQQRAKKLLKLYSESPYHLAGT